MSPRISMDPTLMIYSLFMLHDLRCQPNHEALLYQREAYLRPLLLQESFLYDGAGETVSAITCDFTRLLNINLLWVARPAPLLESGLYYFLHKLSQLRLQLFKKSQGDTTHWQQSYGEPCPRRDRTCPRTEALRTYESLTHMLQDPQGGWHCTPSSPPG